jgi:hypothetical protein
MREIRLSGSEARGEALPSSLPLSSFLGASVKGVDANFPPGRRFRDLLGIAASRAITAIKD